ncbi:expressed unknown protein [Seminavis robusta]|uniref:Uncharacterized protein n=1 Tax=Seminavis robusta TaxID=568900 RepID=A0A9N8E2S8_9STRA|nr:expressed unknown protein [Seminavis robusta]|eukprot:Sro591_g172040.1 n/a (326) ;mRNA; f:35427-36502
MMIRFVCLLSLAEAFTTQYATPATHAMKTIKPIKTTQLWMSTTEDFSTSTSTTDSTTSNLNEDKFLSDLNTMEMELPGMLSSTAQDDTSRDIQGESIWDRATLRLNALATKGRALQQNYAIEISELQQKTPWQDFPERVPLSNAAVWREEGQVPVEATTGATTTQVTTTSESSTEGSAGWGLAMVVGAAAAFAVVQPDTVTSLLNQVNLDVDVASLTAGVSSAIEEAQQAIQNIDLSVDIDMDIDMSAPLQAVQTQVEAIQVGLAAQTDAIKDVVGEYPTMVMAQWQEFTQNLQQATATGVDGIKAFQETATTQFDLADLEFPSQ